MITSFSEFLHITNLVLKVPFVGAIDEHPSVR